MIAKLSIIALPCKLFVFYMFFIKHETDYTVMEQATLQEEFLRYLGIHKVHILAHDLGDTVALEMLAR